MGPRRQPVEPGAQARELRPFLVRDDRARLVRDEFVEGAQVGEADLVAAQMRMPAEPVARQREAPAKVEADGGAFPEREVAIDDDRTCPVGL